MQRPFAAAIGVRAVQQHPRRAGEPKAGHQKSDIRDAPARRALQNRRCGKTVCVAGGEREKEERTDHPHLRLKQRLCHSGTVPQVRLRAVGLELTNEPRLFFRGQPSCLSRSLRQHLQNHHAEYRRRQSLKEEQPLPAREPQLAAQTQQPPGQRAHRHRTQGQGNIEPAHRPRSHPRWKPQRQVIDDAGKEPGLGHAQQEPQQIELERRAHKQHRRCQKSPGKHDSRQPAPGAEAKQQQIRRHLAQRVSDKEKTRAKPVDRCAEVQIAVHLQGGKADIDAVHVGQAVANGEQRQKVHCSFALRTPPDCLVLRARLRIARHVHTTRIAGGEHG